MFGIERICKKRDLEEFTKAQSRGWLLDRSRRSVRLHHAWWKYCGIKEIPYITVSQSKKTSTVRMNLDVCCSRLDDEGYKILSQMVLGAHAKSRDNYWGHQVATIHVKAEDAELFVTHLLDVVLEYSTPTELREF